MDKEGTKERIARGPTPLLLNSKEISALYDCLEATQAALNNLKINFILIAGSLLGAIRSNSFLFCDDDIDIAIFHDDYAKILSELPSLIKPFGTYVKRPWPAADRIRPKSMSHVWVDIFVLQRYETPEHLLLEVGVKDNGLPQPGEYTERILKAIGGAFPIWHYDNRKAIETWPSEFFFDDELFPIRTDYCFGPLLACPGPAHAVQHLRRSYGSDVFSTYRVATQHLMWSKTLRDRNEISLHTAAGAAGTDSEISGESSVLMLEDIHYAPVQHISRSKRIRSSHCRADVEKFVEAEDLWRKANPSDPTRSLSLSSILSLPCVTNTIGGLMPTELPVLAEANDFSFRAPVPNDTQSKVAKPSWFGAAMARYTHYSPLPLVFDEGLLTVMEPHLAKARRLRDTSRSTYNLPAIMPSSEEEVAAIEVRSLPPVRLDTVSSLLDPQFMASTAEDTLKYDTSKFPLADALKEAFGISSDLDLSCFHDIAATESEEARASEGKDIIVANLCVRERRARFHAVFDELVRHLVLPWITSLNPSCDEVYYQAFPCVRIIMPGEFSLAPHCDSNYGHSPANINFIVPLTADGAKGASALYTESSPGLEDWHPLSGGYGTIHRFYGSQCIHFTSENTESTTRASLDFRIIPSRAAFMETTSAVKDVYSSNPNYYRCASKSVTDGTVTWTCIGESTLPDPDYLAGYPFVKSKK